MDGSDQHLRILNTERIDRRSMVLADPGAFECHRLQTRGICAASPASRGRLPAVMWWRGRYRKPRQAPRPACHAVILRDLHVWAAILRVELTTKFRSSNLGCE